MTMHSEAMLFKASTSDLKAKSVLMGRGNCQAEGAEGERGPARAG